MPEKFTGKSSQIRYYFTGAFNCTYCKDSMGIAVSVGAIKKFSEKVRYKPETSGEFHLIRYRN